MDLSFNHPHEQPRYPGGTDITVSLTAAEQAVLGADSGLLLDWVMSALAALVSLRTGEGDQQRHWYGPINDLDRRLIPRLEGVRDAAVRAHAACGGSYGHLASAMDVPRSTAQHRRDVLLASTPSAFETWAANGQPKPLTDFE